MPRKINSYYTEKSATYDSGTDQLFIEIGTDEIICLIKGGESQLIEGFELFHIENPHREWSDIFSDLIPKSHLLNKTYGETNCFYNFEEAVIIPKEKFKVSSAEDYLSLLYGESNDYDIKYDSIDLVDPLEQMIIAYRIKRSVNDLMNKHFVLYKPHHVYSCFVKDMLSRKESEAHFVKLHLYSNHLIVTLVKDRKLQLIQSFKYERTEDILYHIVNITNQFTLHASIAQLEISGIFEENALLQDQLQLYFGKINFDIMALSGVFENIDDQPPHSFTHYSKLVI